MTSASASLLWDPAALAARLDDDGLIVLDVRRGERYANGHISGARHFSVYGINTYDSDPAPLASFTRMWAFQIAGAGIRREDVVVVCSDTTDESAARAFWFLEYLGHERVAVLDGGVRAWEAAGQPLTHEAAAPKASTYPFEAVESVCAAWSDVAAATDDPSTVILDTRTDGEWYGEDARGAARAGAVPSAVHLEWVHNLDDKGCMLGDETLRERYASVGITRDTPVIALLQHRLSLRACVSGAAPARAPERAQLRRFVAGVGEPHGVSDRRARAALTQWMKRTRRVPPAPAGIPASTTGSPITGCAPRSSFWIAFRSPARRSSTTSDADRATSRG